MATRKQTARKKSVGKKAARNNSGPALGAHESIAGGVFNAIVRGEQATCDTIQMFNKSNAQWKAKVLTTEEIDRYFEMIERTGITVACSHSSYLINLASPDKALNKKSYLALKEEVERCNLLKVPNLVFHPGAHVGAGEDEGIATIAENINRILGGVKDNGVTLCLETTAGQGSTIGHTFEQLADIIDRVDDKDHVGVCLDTCHIFAAGYPITEPNDYRKTMKSFDTVIGLDRLKVIHLNDSKKEFGSRRDRHEHIGEGMIGIGAFKNIVNDRKLRKVPMVIETPKGDDLAEDIANLRTLRSLIT
ncbi:deoxyribonuclease IV [candidate division GN15 bacterium]|nr:deoxyribonuclease IV [candidate division GN15 bacterium]